MSIARTGLILLILILSSFSQADDSVCPQIKNQPWDKMEESSFSKAAALKQIDALKKYFNGEIKVADEFLYQSLVILEGSYLRNEMENWKEDPKNYEYYKKNFVNSLQRRI